MYALYKNFTIIYRIASDGITVTSITARGNHSCMYGVKEYPSLQDVIIDIDAGMYN